MKGILLAGGTGSRLFPATIGTSKHLLPIYDKPLIYYSLTNLMLANIRDVILVSRLQDQFAFQAVLGDGSRFGINISYVVQEEPRGIADAFLLARHLIDGRRTCLALGDNIFHGSGLSVLLRNESLLDNGATVLLRNVPDPHRFGIAELDNFGTIVSLEEKPNNPKSNLAVTGLYFFDESAAARVETQPASSRGELEITDLNASYMRDGLLKAVELPRGTMWLDTGTIDSLMDAGMYVRSVQAHTGQLIGSPEEVAWRQEWITSSQLKTAADKQKSTYGDSLRRLLT
jgi:glucose-1-phosphate thymidylyltransferase